MRSLFSAGTSSIRQQLDAVMRVRANLTPEEHKKILEFLKSGT
jgi:hypothetical protein